MKLAARTLPSLLLTLCLTTAIPQAALTQVQLSPDAIAGLDHIPFAVEDLERAIDIWRAIGFSIKPGTTHENAIRNSHIKFGDGSGIELLTAPAAVDELTTLYRALLDQSEGPVFFGLHARDMARLTTTLAQSRYKLLNSDGLVKIDTRHLNYLFFNEDNRSPTDTPYLRHPNGAYAMVRVWVATDRSKELADLLVTLGGELTSRVLYVPDKVNGKVVTVSNGEVVILPVREQLTEDRPIIGATFLVSDLPALEKRLTLSSIPFSKGGSGNQSVVVAPTETHGMWLEFRE